MMHHAVLGIVVAGLVVISWPYALDAGSPSNPFKKPSPAPAGPTTAPPPADVAGTAGVPLPSESAQAAIATLAKKARTLRGAKAASAWQLVLDKDFFHSEALFAIAVMEAANGHKAGAMERLHLLAKRVRPDAIEFLVEARRHAAFETMRADPRFRKLVGIGDVAATDYERLMGHGGQWEQGGTACDRAEVALQLRQTRAFALRVTTRCDGDVSTMKFRGTWKLEAAAPGGVQLQFGKPGKGDSKAASEDASCALAPVADEFSLTCAIDEDLTLTLLPARR